METTIAKGALITGTQFETPTTVDPLLVTILSWPRPHNSPAERDFRLWLDKELPGAVVLSEGCRYFEVFETGGKASTTLFSCHVDTVDAQQEGALIAGPDGKIMHKVKDLTYDPNFGIIGLDPKSYVGTCLGADDGIGVWLMLKMIRAKVPGGYMFHTGEEVGCVGSKAVLAKNSDTLKKYEVAVAFDRPRDNEVITHQNGRTKCASDKFAHALSAQLNKHGFVYAPSDRGVFTDTYHYRTVIAECINLGVGYENQHSRGETQDYTHAAALLDALCAINWSALPVDRDPALPDPVRTFEGATGWRNSEWHKGSLWDDFGPKAGGAAPAKAKKKKGTGLSSVKSEPLDYTPSLSLFEELSATSREDLVCWAMDDPDAVADAIVPLLLEIGRLRSDCAIMQRMSGIKGGA